MQFDTNGNTYSGSFVQPPTHKKRRVGATCDICKRKKIRCDSATMPGGLCSNCLAANLDCTHTRTTPDKDKDQNWDQTKKYIESLEQRLERMESLIRKLPPDTASLQDLDQAIQDDSPSTSQQSLKSTSLSPSNSSKDVSPTPGPSEQAGLPRNDDETISDVLTTNMLKMTFKEPQNIFFGKASGAMLLKTALELKDEYTGLRSSYKNFCLAHRRPYFWNIQPPYPDQHSPSYTFPDDDLMTELIGHFFDEINLNMPLLHRPTFENAIRDSLHLQDSAFGATVLVVCALGSKFSEDPRVSLDIGDYYHNKGWKWYTQVEPLRNILYSPASLYELQLHALSAEFLALSSGPLGCWTEVGIALRRCQEVGLHRSKVHLGSNKIEAELWKRAFWVLISIDRRISPILGRPCALQDDDYDLDLPCDCDDEYWDHPDPELAFKQPPNRPSSVAYFLTLLKLNSITGRALHQLYGVEQNSDHLIVAELDSKLNKWMDEVPEHLRWDPNRENKTFFDQSALIYCNYYHLQMLVHRPFIPSPRNRSQSFFPALVICTNAARSCCHIIDTYMRTRNKANPYLQVGAFTSGVMLLLNIWNGKRSGLRFDPSKDAERINVCLKYLKKCEPRWRSAGRLWDIVNGLASAGDLASTGGPSASSKRTRDSDVAADVPSTMFSVPSDDEPTARRIAGSQRVSSATLHEQTSTPPNPVDDPGQPAYDASLFSPEWFSNIPYPQQSLDSSDVSNGGSIIESWEDPLDPSSYFNAQLISRLCDPNINTPQDDLSTFDPLLQQTSPYENYENYGTSVDNDLWGGAPSGIEFQDWSAYIANLTQENAMQGQVTLSD